MRIRVFQSGAGDCLLVSDIAKKTHMLVDGGLKTPFRKHVLPTLAELHADNEQTIDVICVSHDDQDHISGVLGYVEDLVDWKVYEYQKAHDNDLAKKPRRKRPPAIIDLWHNAFRDLLPADFRSITSYVNGLSSGLAAASDAQLLGMFSSFQKFQASEAESLELSRLAGVAGLRLRVNDAAGGDLMEVVAGAHPIPVGTLNVQVIGPHPEDLVKIRAHWKTWLAANEDALAEIRKEHADASEYLQSGDVERWRMDLNRLAESLGDRNMVTLPNLASLMLLVEHNGKTALLTGDGHHADVIKGLEAIGEAIPYNADVLKIPHHGSEHNSDLPFYEKVTAHHYVFCANGAHENPDLEVVEALFQARIDNGKGPNKPFHLTFNAHPEDTSNTKKRKAHMKEVRELVEERHEKDTGAFTCEFMEDSFVDIDLDGGGD